MDVSIEHTEGLSRRLSIELPAEQLQKAYDSRIRQMSQRAKVPGFRPGKAPMKVLAQRYGDAARAEAVEELLRTSYPEALKQVELQPAGYPTFDVQNEAIGEPLKYTASFEVFPEFEITGLESIEVQRPQVEITDADVERTLDTIRKQHRVWTEVERPAAKGDQIRFDFLGKLDGEPFEGGQAEGHELELGAGQFIESMESALIGMTPNTETTIDVTFPDDYQAEDLKGKTAQFDVKIHAVREGSDPSLDDPELLGTLGVDGEAGEAGLREKVRESLQAERDKAVENKVKEQAMDGLLKANPIDVPSAMVREEIGRMREEAMQRFGNNMPNQDPEALAKMLPDQLFEDNAKRRVALSLLIGEVIKQREINVSDDDIDATIRQYAGSAADSDEAMQYYRSQPQIMQQFRALAMEGKVVESLLTTAKVNDVNMEFDALMNPDDKAS